MKNKYIICNHKNNFTYEEALEYKNILDSFNINNEKFIICPSYIYMNIFNNYNLCSQDISAYDRCITGEVSAKQLKSMNINYTLIGHVERKIFLKENYLMLLQKIKQANNNNIRVIYCISDIEKDLTTCKKNIKEELEIVKEVLKKDAIIAYEPKWAIGKDIIIDYDYIKEVIEYIKNLIDNEIIYGGNVCDSNIEKLISWDILSGLLIGNASSDINTLQKISKLYEKVQ